MQVKTFKHILRILNLRKRANLHEQIFTLNLENEIM